MKRLWRRAVVRAGVFGLAALASAPAWAQYGAKSGEWPSFGGDWGSTKYSDLDQINAQNVKDLKVAWQWATPPSPSGQAPVRELQVTPIYVKGGLYTSTGHDQVARLDPATGQVIWQYDPERAGSGTIRNRSTGRGLAYWEQDGKGRVIHASTSGYLIALDPETGKLIPEFGDGGRVDLRLGLEREIRDYGTVSPPVICRDTIVVGCVVLDGGAVNNTPGHLRGYDTKTGKLKWIFHVIPQPGEVGYETWPPEAWKTVGNTNVWSLMTADQELGYFYFPLSTPSNDWNGSHRIGDNLFAETLLCLDAETGKRVWHFQAVHHGLWDYDFPAAPTLMDLTVDGQKIKAVAQISKQGFVYTFDRVTGKPIWPIEEREVPQTTVPGDISSKTQPFPTKPPAFARQGVTEDMVIDFTPELKQEALAILKRYTIGPLFTPGTIVSDTNGGTIQMPGWGGGGNWQGAAVDPETGMYYVSSIELPIVVGLSGGGRGGGGAGRGGGRGLGAGRGAGRGAGAAAGGAAGGDAAAAAAAAAPGAAPAATRGAAPAAVPDPGAAGAPGAQVAQAPRGGARGGGQGDNYYTRRTGYIDGPEGLPLFKPPYGNITAYDMNKGEIAWRVTNHPGDPEIRNHPRLAGLTLPDLGMAGRHGPLLTKTLLFYGEGAGMTGAGAGGPGFRAFDKKTGALIHRLEMPGNATGTPMTYMHNGKQYIVVAIGSREVTGTICAMALP